jgi:hypothetical protein
MECFHWGLVYSVQYVLAIYHNSAKFLYTFRKKKRKREYISIIVGSRSEYLEKERPMGGVCGWCFFRFDDILLVHQEKFTRIRCFGFVLMLMLVCASVAREVTPFICCFSSSSKKKPRPLRHVHFPTSKY